MKTFLSENQRWPFSRFSFFITLEVGDASGADQKDRRQRDNFDAIWYPESYGRVFVSGADQKTRRLILT